MSDYTVEITIEFEEKPNDEEVRNYLLKACKKSGGLRWDLNTPNAQILDAQEAKKGS